MNNKSISIMLISFLIVGGFADLFNFKSENVQGLFVSGPITMDTTWDLAGSPYIVNGDVTVESGVTLTIEPGVWVTFDGYYAIYVYGSIIAIGTESDRIIINSFKVFAEPRDWRNIQIESSGFGEFKYCNVSHSDYGITCYSSNNLITNNSFSNNSHGIDVTSSSNNNIINNNFWSNTAQCIYLTSSTNNIITNNKFWNNTNGIRLRTSSDNIISNNNISNNRHGLYLQESINDTIIDNKISNNGVGIYVRDSSNINIINNDFINDGVYIYGFVLSNYNTHNIPDNNTINGKPLLYYKDTTSLIIDGILVGQIILTNCKNIEVKNIQLMGIEVGIQVAFSSDILIADNNIKNNNFQNISVSSDAIGGISLFKSSNNIITNNTLINNGNAGISIMSSSNNNIISFNNVSSNIYDGIRVGRSSFNNINGNDVSNHNTGIGIGGELSDNTGYNVATNNNILNNLEGIFLSQTEGNDIAGNNILYNSWGIGIRYSSENKIINNNISESEYGVYCFEGSPDNEITSNTILNNNNGTYLEDSPNCIIANNDISNNEEGLILRKSPGSEISANKISSNNNRGIYVYMSSNSNVTSNDVSNNLYGIYIAKVSNDVIVRNNNISYNDYGIFINWTTDNLIYHNKIIGNTVQAYDNTINGNLWNTSYPDGGNFWSDFNEPGEGAYDDYEGPDQDVPGSDDIVDNGTIGGGGRNPYIIDSDSQDNYPLIFLYDYMFLYEGWNLISIPLIQPDNYLDTVLTPISGSYDAVQWYNVSDSTDHWKHNHIQKPSQMNDLTEMTHTMGFWIHITEPGGVIFEYNGIKPSQNQSIPLHVGWNLVGYPSLTSHNRTVGLNNIMYGPDVDCIQWYDASSKTWHFMGPDDLFSPGRGYWVHSKVETVWDVPV